MLNAPSDLASADAPEMSELGLIEPLGNILSQLTQGGGAKGINIDAVSPSLPLPVWLPVCSNKCTSMHVVAHDSCNTASPLFMVSIRNHTQIDPQQPATYATREMHIAWTHQLHSPAAQAIEYTHLMMQVTIALEQLSKEYPIDIPPYFALILRAFSVIEGTALRVDPDYAIVKETFPYLSRRLLTDNHPRARAALRQLLYGVSPACSCARHAWNRCLVM